MLCCIVTVVGDSATDDGVVLLFHEAVVILAIGATTSKANLFGITVTDEMAINTLTASIRVQSTEPEGRAPSGSLEPCKNMAWGLVLHGNGLFPSGRNIDKIQ